MTTRATAILVSLFALGCGGDRASSHGGEPMSPVESQPQVPRTVDSPAPDPDAGQPDAAPPPVIGDPEIGERLWRLKGCHSCHTRDGKTKVGPSHKGLFTRIEAGTTKLSGGQTYADIIGPGKRYPDAVAYVRDQILQPQSVVRDGFSPVMPTYAGNLTDREIASLIAYLRTLD